MTDPARKGGRQSTIGRRRAVADVAANVLLGISQGLTWSTTVIMKIDLAGPNRRGLAMGLNEAAGYTAVAVTALATGYLAASYGLRPEPFYLGIACAALGLGLSTLAVRETREHARLEASTHAPRSDGRNQHLHAGLTGREVFVQTSFREPALSSASQAGLVNNLNDGLAWGLFPVLFAAAGISVARIGVLARAVPGRLGPRATGHRRAVRPVRPQTVHRHRPAHPGRSPGHGRCRRHLHRLGRRRRPTRRRHRHGLPDPAGRHRRRRPPDLAGQRRWRVPVVARRRVR
ncbi:MAG TPA: MFS transporter, partial [Nakamurella sp.]